MSDVAKARAAWERRGVTTNCECLDCTALTAYITALEQTLATERLRVAGVAERLKLSPAASMVLTIANAQIERGDEVPPNSTAVLVMELNRFRALADGLSPSAEPKEASDA